MTVMNKVGGWNEVVPRCVHVEIDQSGFLRRTQAGPTCGPATIIYNVSWVTEDSLWDHERITETKVTMKENLILEALNFDIDVPCRLQSRIVIVGRNVDTCDTDAYWDLT